MYKKFPGNSIKIIFYSKKYHNSKVIQFFFFCSWPIQDLKSLGNIINWKITTF